MSRATLADLAAAAGLTAADIAHLSGVSESTISRLWTAGDWLTKTRTATLFALIPAVPACST